MLTVTDNAKQLLKELLLAQAEDPDFGLRLVVEPSGKIGLVLDREAPGDYLVVEHEESKVLLVGHEVAGLLAGITLDTHDTPDGIRLVISKDR